jgi:multidrug efflux system membrane fusion protein
MTRRYVLVKLAGALALASSLVGCQKGPQVAELPPPPVVVSNPVVREVVDFDSYEGSVKARKKIDLRTQSRGYLVKVNFKDGDVVEAGKLLFEVDPETYQLSLDAAKAQEKAATAALDYATSEHARVKRLVIKDAASREELEVWTAKQLVAKADKRKAEVAIKQAQVDLDHATIKAPITGRVNRTQVNAGDLINAGGGDTLLATIVSIGPAYVYFDVDERALIRYLNAYKPKEGLLEPTLEARKIPLYVALEGEDGYPHVGVIDYADPWVNQATGTKQARGWMPNKSNLFQDGMRARVRVPIGPPYKALLITERAIGTERGRKFVYVLNDKDEVERRDDLSFGRNFDGLQVVKSGLTEKDRVIVSGIQRVREGLVVKPKETPMPDVGSLMPMPKAPEKPKE